MKTSKQVGLRGLPEVNCCGVVRASKNGSGVCDGHLLERLCENDGSLGHGLFGGAIHGGHKLIREFLLFERAQSFLNGMEFLRHGNADVEICQKSAFVAEL